MTAHQLARQLLAGPDHPVHFQYTYGDYWRTEVAPKAVTVVAGEVTDSPSLGMPRLAGDDDDNRSAVVLIK